MSDHNPKDYYVGECVRLNNKVVLLRNESEELKKAILKEKADSSTVFGIGIAIGCFVGIVGFNIALAIGRFIRG